MNRNKITEKQNPISENIDEQSILGILNIINLEDAKVSIAIKNSLFEIERFIESLIDRFKKGGRLFYIGSGTSGRLGILDAAECPPTFRTNPDMIQGIIAGGYNALVCSIEGAEDFPEAGADAIIKNSINQKDVVLGITASSSTPFVLGALEKAKELQSLTGLLICNASPDLTFIDHLISIIVGPEIIAGSTRMKAGTATKMVLNMITTTAMIRLNKTYGNLMVDLQASNNKLWDRGTRIITHLTDFDYDDAFQLLKSADGEVKTAIVMKKLNLNKKDSREILNNNFGSLKNSLKNK